MFSSAIFSSCRIYRYLLRRRWLLGERGVVLLLGHNPSKADGSDEDPTSTRSIDFAQRWGFQELVMANFFALVATDPAEVYRHPAPIGPENDRYLRQAIGAADLVVCAWGNIRAHHERATDIKNMIRAAGKVPHVLKLNQTGQPSHPLYLFSGLKPVEWQ